MQCLRCGNTEKRYFYKDAKGWYCRKCIMFGRIGVGELPERKNVCRKPIHTAYQLKYPLTPAQKRCASEIVMYLNHHQDVLVYAACGFRVIIVTVANSLGNIRVFELLPKLKTKKYGWCIA